MKKIYLLWIPVLCLLWRCNENDHMTWKSKGGVYFEDYSQEADSLQYSFRMHRFGTGYTPIDRKIARGLTRSADEFPGGYGRRIDRSGRGTL